MITKNVLWPIEIIFWDLMAGRRCSQESSFLFSLSPAVLLRDNFSLSKSSLSLSSLSLLSPHVCMCVFMCVHVYVDANLSVGCHSWGTIHFLTILRILFIFETDPLSLKALSGPGCLVSWSHGCASQHLSRTKITIMGNCTYLLKFGICFYYTG